MAQELGDPSLKPIQLEAATAFALLKYLPVAVLHIQDVVDCLLESSKMEQWHARAAGLVYLQVLGVCRSCCLVVGWRSTRDPKASVTHSFWDCQLWSRGV